MNDSPTADKESIDLGTIDCPRVGVDAEGTTHYHDTEGDRILLARDGTVVATRDLAGRSLDAWKAYVADERGWATVGTEQFASATAAVAGEC